MPSPSPFRPWISDRNLSDSDSMASGEQPAEVTIPVVALQEVVAGYGGSSPINADGAFTPSAATLNLWRDAAGALTIFVDLKDGKSGLSIRDGGVRSTADRLVVGNHGVAADKITTSWDARKWRLSLVGTSTCDALWIFRSSVGRALQLRDGLLCHGQLSDNFGASVYFRRCVGKRLSCTRCEGCEVAAGVDSGGRLRQSCAWVGESDWFCVRITCR